MGTMSLMLWRVRRFEIDRPKISCQFYYLAEVGKRCLAHTFMNQPLMSIIILALMSFVVVYDDLDLEPGKLRTQSGSAGGRNGVKRALSMWDKISNRSKDWHWPTSMDTSLWTMFYNVSIRALIEQKRQTTSMRRLGWLRSVNQYNLDKHKAGLHVSWGG